MQIALQTINLTIPTGYKMFDNRDLMLYDVISSMDIIKRLETYRLEHRISQKELSKLLGVAFATVNRWFNGRTHPNRIQTYHIEKLLQKEAKK